METGGQVVHEMWGPTEVELRITRYAKTAQHGDRKPSEGVKVLPKAICRTGLAVADVASALGERSEQIACLLSERMLCAVAGSVEPPYLPPRPFCCQRVQHGKHRRCSHTGAQKDDRAFA